MRRYLGAATLLGLFAWIECSLCEDLPDDAAEYDITIVGGRIIDGSGNPWFKADLGIRDGKIVAIGNLADARTKVRRDVEGEFVTPGFIDMMGQSSIIYVSDRKAAESRLRQGITTHFSGEGWSHAPQNEHTQSEPEYIAGRPVRWRRYSEYFAILEAQELALNVVHNVGAAQVRRMVIGDNDRAPTAAQLAAMKELVRQAMEDGAVGLSSALIYPPGSYASTDELVELAKVAASYGGVYFTHMRNESHDLLSAIEEAIQIGKAAEIPVHIYHLKAAGEQNWPLMTRAIDRINTARADGLDITADIYPYIRNSIGIRAFINPAQYSAGREVFIAKLADAAVRSQIRSEIEAETTEWENWYQSVGHDWSKVLITRLADYPDPAVAGLSVAEAAERNGIDAWEMFFDLVRANAGVCPASMNEQQKSMVLQVPWVMISTDSSPANPETLKSTHPRAFGAFPRVLAKYVRDDKVLPLEDAVRRMTSLPANTLGLRDRGRIALNMAADIAVFDAHKIQDLATFTDPMRYATGIDYLLVNGKLVVDRGQITDVLPGWVLRSSVKE
jgi:N-acyl-D-aspartate/D-glutamate deacylase